MHQRVARVAHAALCLSTVYLRSDRRVSGVEMGSMVGKGRIF